MKIDVFKIGNDIALPELYQQCMASLRDHSRIVVFMYPNRLTKSHSSDADWAASIAEIRELNESQLLNRLDNQVNCYALYTRELASDWCLRYLGQAEVGRIKSHITAQLAPVGNRSNSVFEKSKKIVQAGGEMGLRLIKIEPDTLRHFVQEKALAELRKDGMLDWNRVKP
jgi:hypothetical protein